VRAVRAQADAVHARPQPLVPRPSGPRRFEYRPATKAWHATSDGSRLDELLSSELTKLVGEPVQMRFDLDG